MRKLTASMCMLAVGLAAAVLLAPARVHAQANRPTVALLDFDFGTVQKWWEDNTDIGKGISDLVVDAILEDGSFRVFERKKLASVLGEQDLANSNRADPDAKMVAKLGKVAGVKYLITGSITKFGTEDSKKGGFGGLGGKVGMVAGVGMTKGKATVAITARIIDTSTSEILVSAKGEAVSSRSGLLLGGGAKGFGGAGGFGSSGFKDTIIGEATEKAVAQLVANMVAKKDRIPAK